MAFAIQKETVNIKNAGTSVTLPDDCFARLMYYLRSVSSCVPGLDIPANLTNYQNYRSLNSDDRKLIVHLADLLPPHLLDGKIFHQVDDDDIG